MEFGSEKNTINTSSSSLHLSKLSIPMKEFHFSAPLLGTLPIYQIARSFYNHEPYKDKAPNKSECGRLASCKTTVSICGRESKRCYVNHNGLR